MTWFLCVRALEDPIHNAGKNNSCTPKLTEGLAIVGWKGNPEIWALASDREFIQSLFWDLNVLEVEESCSLSKGEVRILQLSVNFCL